MARRTAGRSCVRKLARIASLSCVGGTFVCLGSVMGARLSEGFNPEIDGEDVTQVCFLELSWQLFDSITTLPLEILRSRVCGRRTRPLLDCRASAFGALSPWRCRARREIPRGTLPVAECDLPFHEGHPVGRSWIEGIRAGVRLHKADEVVPQHHAWGQRPRSSLRYWKSCAASGLQPQHCRSNLSCNQPQHGVQLSWALLRRRC